MGAANFAGCGRFGIWAIIEEYDETFYKEEYPELSDAERYQLYAEDASVWYERHYLETKEALRDLNLDLTFFKLDVKSGYYDGLEIVLEEEPWSEAPEDLAEIVEEELKPYWVGYEANRTKKKHLLKVKRMFDDECEKIEDWLETEGRDLGFRPLGVVNRFSTGETWYAWDRTERNEGSDPTVDNGIAEFFSRNRKILGSKAARKAVSGSRKPHRTRGGTNRYGKPSKAPGRLLGRSSATGRMR